jgi:pectinesterase
VFRDCKITGASQEVKTYLGRPWRGFSAVTYINTEMSENVQPAGWDNWKLPEREKKRLVTRNMAVPDQARPRTRV